MLSSVEINIPLLIALKLFFIFTRVEAYTGPPDPGKCGDGTGVGFSNLTWAGSLCTPTTFSHGYHTIGNLHLVRDNSTEFLRNLRANADLSDTGWDLQVAPLQYKNGIQDSYIYGWLHVTLSGGQGSRDARAIIIQGEIDTPNIAAPAGAFVRLSSTNCGPSASASTETDYVPCGYAQEPMPFTGWLFAKVADAGKTLEKSYSLNFQIFFPWCQVYSSSVGLYFRTYILGPRGSNQAVGVSLVGRRVVYFDTGKIYGAPAVDPFPPLSVQSTLSCPALTDSNKPPWIAEVTNPGTRNFSTPWRSATLPLCTNSHAHPSRCHNFSTSNPFYGLHPVHAYQCQGFGPITNQPDFYDIYFNEMYNFTFTCSDSCNKSRMRIVQFGEEVSSVIGRQIWGARKSHGVLMVISYFGVYPLTSIMARFYKESFMGARYVVNIHLWYAVHICGGILLFGLVIVSNGIAFYGSIYFGHSLSKPAITHRKVGYAAHFLCLLGILTNGLRCRSPPLRKVCILAHSLSGVLYQVTSLHCIYTSVYIPGSPTGTASIDRSPDKLGAGFGFILPVALLWTGYDVVMNIVVMLQLRRVDSYTFMNPKRTWVGGFIPTPTLGADATRDYKDSIERIEYLGRFAVVSGIATFLAVFIVSVPSPIGRVLGQMSLTHSEDGLQYPPLFTESGDSAII